MATISSPLWREISDECIVDNDRKKESPNPSPRNESLSYPPDEKSNLEVPFVSFPDEANLSRDGGRAGNNNIIHNRLKENPKEKKPL